MQIVLESKAEKYKKVFKIIACLLGCEDLSTKEFAVSK